jgi:uncharacterized protein
MNLNTNSKLLDEIIAYGHKNIQVTHSTTIELTKEEILSLKGDCILGIKSSKSCFDLSESLKNEIHSGKLIKVHLIAGEESDFFFGKGNKDLSLNNQISLVFRKSNYICDRTILISCTKSAKDINRKIVEYLKDPTHKILIQFYTA